MGVLRDQLQLVYTMEMISLNLRGERFSAKYKGRMLEAPEGWLKLAGRPTAAAATTAAATQPPRVVTV